MADEQITEKKPLKQSRGGGGKGGNRGGQGGNRGGHGGDGGSGGQGGSNGSEKQQVGERSEVNSDRGRGNSSRGRYDRGGGGRGERVYSDRGRGGRRGRGGGGQIIHHWGMGGYSHEMRDHQRQKQPRTDIRSGPKTEDQLFEGNISSGINFSKYENIPVTVDGNSPPKPITSFADSGLHSIILKNVERCGYTSLTPVQKYSIPIVLNNRDLMACAQTGSGKTAAFLMPAIHQFLTSGLKSSFGKCQSPQCLVITPTRELAIQIYDEARKFAFSSGLRAALAYGGVSTGSQASSMAEGCNFLVATPGRLIDFMQQGKVSFDQVKYLVLDEGDKMMDMGFIPDIKRIVNHPSMPKKETRQTLMFSATFPPTIKKVANEFLNNFLFLSVGVVGGACTDVEQVFYQVAKRDKKNRLSEVLKNSGSGKTLVFIRTKHKTQRLAQQLTREGFPATSIHGDRTQPQRELALAEFRDGTKDILMATDVVARGLDIKDVAHVINYDMPRDIEEYVHRIGRTGRVGNCGKATSFYDMEEDGSIVNDLVKILTQCDQIVPDWLAAQVGVVPAKKKKHKNKGGMGQSNKEDNLDKKVGGEGNNLGASQGENRRQKNVEGKGNRVEGKVEEGLEKQKGESKKEGVVKEGSSESSNSRKRRNKAKKAVKENNSSVNGQFSDLSLRDENHKQGTKKKMGKENYVHEHDVRVEGVEHKEDRHVEKNRGGKDRRHNSGRKDFTEEDQKRHQEGKVKNPEEKTNNGKKVQPIQDNNHDPEEARFARRNSYHENTRGRRNHDHRVSVRSHEGKVTNAQNSHDSQERQFQGNRMNRVPDDRHHDHRQSRVPDDRNLDHRQNREPDDRNFDHRQNRVPDPGNEINELLVKERAPESNSRKFEDPRGGASRYEEVQQDYQNDSGGQQEYQNNRMGRQEFQNNGIAWQDYQNSSGGRPEFQYNGMGRQEYQNYGRGRQDFQSNDYRASQSTNRFRLNQNYESRGRNHNSNDNGAAGGFQDYQEEGSNVSFGSSDVRYRDGEGGRVGRGRPSSRGGRPTGRRLNNAAADIVGILNQQAKGTELRGGRGDDHRVSRGEDCRGGREGSFDNRQNNSGPTNDSRSNDARNNPGPTPGYRDARRYGGPPSPPAINQEVADYASLMELQARLAQERADRSATRNTERNRPTTRDLANTSNWPSLEASLEGGR